MIYGCFVHFAFDSQKMNKIIALDWCFRIHTKETRIKMKIDLKYFDFTGRGEVLRILLHGCKMWGCRIYRNTHSVFGMGSLETHISTRSDPGFVDRWYRDDAQSTSLYRYCAKNWSTCTRPIRWRHWLWMKPWTFWMTWLLRYQNKPGQIKNLKSNVMNIAIRLWCKHSPWSNHVWSNSVSVRIPFVVFHR